MYKIYFLWIIKLFSKELLLNGIYLNNLNIENHLKLYDNMFVIFFNKTDGISEDYHYKWLVAKEELSKKHNITINVSLYMGNLSDRLVKLLNVYKYPKIKLYSKGKASKAYTGGKAVNHIINWVKRDFRKPSLSSIYISDYDNFINTLEKNDKSIILWTRNQELAAFEFFQKFSRSTGLDCYHMDNLILLKILFLKLNKEKDKINRYIEYFENDKALDEEDLKEFNQFREKHENDYFIFIHYPTYEKNYYDLVLCKEGKLKECIKNNKKMIFRNINKLFESTLDIKVEDPIVLYNYQLNNYDKNFTIDFDFLSDKINDMKKVNNNLKFVIFDAKYDTYHDILKRFPKEYNSYMLMDLRDKRDAKFYEFKKDKHDNFNKFYSLFYNDKLEKFEKSEEEIDNPADTKILQAVKTNFYNFINERAKTIVLYYYSKDHNKYKDLYNLLLKLEVNTKKVNIIEINANKNEVIGINTNDLPYIKLFIKGDPKYIIKTLYYTDNLEKLEYLLND